MRFKIVPLIAVFAFVLAGCGDSADKSGDSSSGGDDATKQTPALTKSELIAKGDEICKELEKGSKKIDNGTSNEDIAQNFTDLIDLYTTALDQLKELTPPEDLADTYEQWLDENDATMETMTKLKVAIKNDDQTDGEKLNEAFNKQSKELDRLSRKIGFKTCTQL
jgi:hypothetical protein